MASRKTINNDPKFIGQKFGRLTVVGFQWVDDGREQNPCWHWNCVCDCGKKVYGIRPRALKSGATLSCGCLKKEQDKKNIYGKRRTHGKSDTRLFHIWVKIKDRCLNEKCPAYANYGGRGISVCKEWMSFEPFFDWAVNNGYEENLTIERKDVNGNYCLENCSWITKADQAKNKRTTRYVTVDCERMCLKDACEKLGLPYKAVHLRITKRGWSVERALSEPIHDNSDSMKRKCKEAGLPYTTVLARIKSGWSEEKALTTPLLRKKKK